MAKANKTENFSELLDAQDSIIARAMPLAGFVPSVPLTDTSLEEMELAILKLYPQGRLAKVVATIPFGFYLAKTVMALFPGSEWRPMAETIWDIELEVPMPKGRKMVLKPFKRVAKFMRNKEDSIVCLIDSLHFYGNHDVFDLELMNKVSDAEGWVHFPRGTCMRVWQVSEEAANDPNFVLPGDE